MNIKTRKKVAIRLLQYFVFNPSALVRIKNHLKLAEVLRYYKRNNLITYRTYIIYIFSYISRSFKTEDKFAILYYHYTLLRKIFPDNQLKLLFNEGIICADEQFDGDQLSILLIHSAVYEFEGSLCFYLKVNNHTIAKLSFTFAPGHIFNSAKETILYISCLQRLQPAYDELYKSIDFLKELHLSNILLKATEALGMALAIEQCLAISVNNQLSVENESAYQVLQHTYDDFWKEKGGIPTNGDYLFSFPLYQKPISEIKQSHRNRTLKKRSKLNLIYSACYNKLKSVTVQATD